ncbi:hypothetical protein AAG570_011347 [Ranatra chinensis]|uniref:Uncharacterized protein n=1 Tax=Ranatra chinensis TaxID=642074 RepID=A0ABD0YMI2_9HEMI
MSAPPLDFISAGKHIDNTHVLARILRKLLKFDESDDHFRTDCTVRRPETSVEVRWDGESIVCAEAAFLWWNAYMLRVLTAKRQLEGDWHIDLEHLVTTTKIRSLKKRKDEGSFRQKAKEQG